MRNRVKGLVLVLFSVAVGSAFAPPEEATPERIRSWIEQLASEEYVEREAARQALEAAAPDAWETIERQLEGVEDPDVRMTIEDLLVPYRSGERAASYREGLAGTVLYLRLPPEEARGDDPERLDDRIGELRFLRLPSGEEGAAGEIRCHLVCFVVSPIGDRIAFLDAEDELCVANPDGSEATRLGYRTNSALSYGGPVFSTDGRFLAFTDGPRIRVYDLDAGRETASFAGIWPAWSPDGSRIAYVDVRQVAGEDGAMHPASDVFVCRPDGTESERLTDYGSHGLTKGIAWPVPDGIVAIRAMAHPMGWHRIDPVRPFRGTVLWPFRTHGGGSIRTAAARSGSRIAVHAYPEKGAVEDVPQLFWLDTAEEDPMAVSPLAGRPEEFPAGGSFPCWSADGGNLLFHARGHLYAVSAEAEGEPVRLSRGLGGARFPVAWLPE